MVDLTNRINHLRCLTSSVCAEYVRQMATTIYHPIGTCKIGADGDELAVVDSALRVRGVQGLRVIDASVMPLIPNVNTDLPTRMVGYHAAEMMVEERRMRDRAE